MFFDPFYEGREPRPLFLLLQERLAPYHELDVNYIVKHIRHASFHRKDAGKRFLKVSIPDFTRYLTAYSSGHSSDGRGARK